MDDLNELKAQIEELVCQGEIDISVDYGEVKVDCLSRKAERVITAMYLCGKPDLFYQLVDRHTFTLWDAFQSECIEGYRGQTDEFWQRLVNGICEDALEDGLLLFYTKEELQTTLKEHPHYQDLYDEWTLACSESD